MESTDNEMIPFPEGNDPGNGALDLQLIAERVNTLAGAQQVELRRIINKPGKVLRLSANTSGVSSGIFTDIFALGTWLPVFDSTYPSTLPKSGFSNAGLGDTPGIYRVGVYLNIQCTGALTANSLRQLYVQAAVPSDPTIFPASITNRQGFSTNYDPSGALGMTAELEIYTPYPSNPVSTNGGTVFTAIFFHSNVASTVQLNAGSIAWLYRVADVELV